jgi:predicted small metal-binding protein
MTTTRARVIETVKAFREVMCMRAIDCSEGHDTIHLAAESDEELMEKVRAHTAEVHPDLTEEQVQGIFNQLVHDE